MIIQQFPAFNRDVVQLLLERIDPDRDLALIQAAVRQLENHPRIGELYRGDIRRRYLPRLRSHLYYRYRPRLQRIELLRLWPAYRLPPI